MKKLAFLIIVATINFSCKNDQYLPEPSVNINLGYLTDNGGGIHVENYLIQDFILRSELDTAIAVTILENNLEQIGLNPKILNNLEFTIYVNTSRDNEIFVRNKNVYSIGAGGGSNNLNQLSSIANYFVLPIRITESIIANDNKLELDPYSDFIRISYESNYSGLSIVKTFFIKN
jgi:hypothetical protein